MTNKLKFNPTYFLLALLLFITEIIIALFVHDAIVRPYIGDFLVVILIYCFVRSFLNTPVIPTAIAVLIFSFAVETAQYFKIINTLRLQHSKLARIIMGDSFSWTDILCYTCGILLVVITEKLLQQKK